MSSFHSDSWSEGFEARIAEEVRRCERYNRFFTLAVLIVDEDGAALRLSLVRGVLRRTDLVAVLDMPSSVAEEHPEIATSVPIGVLMPETRRADGEQAMKRVLLLLGDAVRRHAVVSYPDDATRAHSMISSAFDRIGNALIGSCKP